jgi:hypothetical protein
MEVFKMRKISLLILTLLVIITIAGCSVDSSDQTQHDQQEALLKEATAQTGMPAIKNFRERKILKEIIEMRDQALPTYLYNEFSGQLIFLGNSIGYGIPYATQYTNPMKYVYNGSGATLPQADPNGLFSPPAAEGTWILLKNPNGTEVKPVYIEPRIVVSPFRLK